MLVIGLALASSLGFGAASIFARLGIQGIKPLPSTLNPGGTSLLPTALLTIIFTPSDISGLPAVAHLCFLGDGALTFLGGRARTNWRSLW